ncbi:hypothetical protein AKJ09_02681 [Labilithrix luteola]|uniref:Lipoprotein n=1 Tax=Labilithrix luteola TaxID=1391654 RepID=A0A0K1PR69_9BACT|nr:hypothetical protein [Labilithrix luteola]AKU96017.1 hypothetical protein AKJ09_02681 [Labilithrix luteola]
MRRGSFGIVIFAGFTWLAAIACGESRSPIGEECLRSDDCLSGVCSDRVCVSAPPLTLGGGSPPADEQPDIPTGGAQSSNDGGDAQSPRDAGSGG